MNHLTGFRDTGSFIAGLLIGVSFVITVFAMTVADPGRGQMVGVIIAPLVLALGLVLQVVVTRTRHSTNGRGLAAFKLGNFLWRASMGALGGIGQAAMVVFLVLFVFFLLLGGD